MYKTTSTGDQQCERCGAFLNSFYFIDGKRLCNVCYKNYSQWTIFLKQRGQKMSETGIRINMAKLPYESPLGGVSSWQTK